MSGSRALGTNPRANGRSLRQLGLSPRQLAGASTKRRPRAKHQPRDAGVPRKLRFEILKRDGFACTYCGARGSDGVELHVDHILAASRGGRTVRHNLRTACRDCNLGKGADLLCESAS